LIKSSITLVSGSSGVKLLKCPLCQKIEKSLGFILVGISQALREQADVGYEWKNPLFGRGVSDSIFKEIRHRRPFVKDKTHPCPSFSGAEETGQAAKDRDAPPDQLPPS